MQRMNIKEHAASMRQTADAIEQCESGVPDGFRLECRLRNKPDSWRESSGTDGGMYLPDAGCYYRLVPIPRLVPLEAKDIVIGKTIFGLISGSPGGGCLVVFANSMECMYVNGVGLCKHTYQSLFDDAERVYSNDHGSTWQPCSKPEGAGQ